MSIGQLILLGIFVLFFINGVIYAFVRNDNTHHPLMGKTHGDNDVWDFLTPILSWSTIIALFIMLIVAIVEYWETPF